MPEQREDLSPAEFARKTGLSLGYIYALLWSGKLPGDKRNGIWFIPQAALEQIRQRREVLHEVSQ